MLSHVISQYTAEHHDLNDMDLRDFADNLSSSVQVWHDLLTPAPSRTAHTQATLGNLQTAAFYLENAAEESAAAHQAGELRDDATRHHITRALDRSLLAMGAIKTPEAPEYAFLALTTLGRQAITKERESTLPHPERT